MSKTILVIEDDRAVAQMLRDVLEDKGHRVLVETDGEWGLRTFEHKPVDLVVLDVLVPKLVGFDLVDRLRKSEKGRHVGIIVLSGVYRASVHRAKMIEKYGIVDYFDKPVDLDRFLHAVREVFRQSQVTGDIKPPPLLTIPPDVRAIDESEALVGAAAEQPRLPSTRGSIENIPFARLLGDFYAARASGALMLRRSAMKKIVYLKEGIPVYVKSNLVSECLGRVMVRDRLISEKECEQSVERLKREKRKQGQILIEMGAISQHNLDYGLERQMEIKLHDLFSWLEGKYLFTEAREHEGPEVALSMAPTEMIHDGVRRTMSADRVYRDLSRIESMLLAPSDDPTFRYQAIQLEPRAEKVLDAIDGSRTLREVLDLADFDRDDAAMLIYALTATGLVSSLSEAVRKYRTPALLRERTKAPPPIIQLDDADVVQLKTAEISIDDPALSAIAAARRKASEVAAAARRTAEETLKNETESADDILARSARDARVIASKIAVEEVVITPEAVKAETPKAAEMARAESEEAPATAEADWGEYLPESEEDVDSGAADHSAIEPARKPDVKAAIEPADEPALESAGESASEPASRPMDEPAIERVDEPAPPARAATSPAVQNRKPSQSHAPVDLPTIDIERERARVHAQLEQTHGRLQGRNYYERLGVRRHASRADIEKAFTRLSRDHHPDHILAGHASVKTRSLAEDIYLLIRRSYEALTHDAERAAYDRSLLDESDAPGIARAIAAEEAFRRGVAHTEQGDWDTALVEFQRAAEHNPAEGMYVTYLAWASFCSEPENPEVSARALQELDAAIDRNPRLEDAHVFRGLIQEKAGLRDEAIGSLRDAIGVNADCVRALRALRTLAPPPEKKTGFLARLGVGD